MIQLVQTGDGWTKWRCTRCGFGDIDRAGHFPDKIHCPCGAEAAPTGLGDFVYVVLHWLGFRQSRCGCAKRQEKLNRFGWWLRSLFR